MKQRILPTKFNRTILMLCCAVLALWVAFYFFMENYLKKSTLENISQVSKSVIYSIDAEFIDLENISGRLSDSPLVSEALLAEDYITFYDLSAAAALNLDTIIGDDSTADIAILFRPDGTFYRLKGSLSNTVVGNIYKTVSTTDRPHNISFSDGSFTYIGYSVGVLQGEDRIGYIVLLLAETTVKQIIDVFYETPGLSIALTAENMLIFANNDDITEDTVINARESGVFYNERHIGLTPFKIAVFADESRINGLSISFSIALLVTGILLFSVVFVFLRFWRKRFFYPMSVVISEIRALREHDGTTISPTGEPYFDGLVSQINEMSDGIRQREKELYLSKSALQQAEYSRQKLLLISLKKQISAHFTVNTLNSVRALVKKGNVHTAEIMCDSLSHLLRYANAGEDTIHVLDELFIIQQYVTIMQLRYPDKFEVSIGFDDELDAYQIPRMLIQPIVENSILHGFHKTASGGTIQVTAAISEDCLQVTVADNGCGLGEDALTKLRQRLASCTLDDMEHNTSGIALVNIQRRILSLFGKDYGLEITATEGTGTQTMITLPILQ